MRAFTFIAAALSASLVEAVPAQKAAQTDYAGYLISTFSDPTPQVQWHLSDGKSASSFKFLNGGSPVLTSNVGTKGVRDIFLATNSKRSEYFTIATGTSSEDVYLIMGPVTDGFWDKQTWILTPRASHGTGPHGMEDGVLSFGPPRTLLTGRSLHLGCK